MGFSGQAHALRAVLLACGIACFGATMAASASTLELAALEPAESTAEPFGLSTLPVSGGGLLAKWRGVAHQIDDERVQLALCDGDRERCASNAALKFLAIVDDASALEGRARLGEINRAINLAIRPMSDLAQWGRIDVWSSPLVTFSTGAGDCEDYAIAKFVALRFAGVAAGDLRIIVLRDLIHGEGHAVVSARLDGHWLILDNRRMAMVEDSYLTNYLPLFVIDDSGVMRYSDMPLLANLPEAAPVTASSDGRPPGIIGYPADVAFPDD
ncbi:transglutaminase-like cysteine peptidase [Bradyrhizobium sp.]|uniref:transglutaminase-like cysteine peptidase n=1 Tax=Bradyrhizobium sp. TaxID=376 RepID=UPI003C484088